jgi:Holliday junction resolvase RusA-like endonuclease
LNVFLFFGDRRKRDLDNVGKSVLDSLNKLLYDDDSQIDELYLSRQYDIRSPRAVITITRMRDSEV